MRQLSLRTLLVALLVCGAGGCAARKGKVHDSVSVAVKSGQPLAVSDALEVLIAEGIDTPADREYAYEAVRTNNDDTAAATFARAAVTGRWVQQRGLRARKQVAEVEWFAQRSRVIDPDFRDGAATRLLGTLYVVAPASLLAQGDSETGLELLENLEAKYPDVLENHLRLGEAYITLGDPEPAIPHLCRCLAEKDRLRPDDQKLLHQLVAEAGQVQCE